jgi:APA family basic amino acid/polyamine antiporter
LIAVSGAFFPIGVLTSLTNMGTFVAFILVAVAVPLLRNRHPELRGSFTIPFGPYIVPTLAALSALGMMYYLRVGNPVVWGFFPIAWLGFLIWLIVGLFFYFSYGRNKSTVALEQAERRAVRQPRVN